jgi:hypothetical protein
MLPVSKQLHSRDLHDQEWHLRLILAWRRDHLESEDFTVEAETLLRCR